MSGGNLQPLASPDPFNPFDVNHLALIAQYRRNAAIAIAAVLDRQPRDVGGQGRLVIAFSRDIAQRGALLAETPAGEPFGTAMFGDHILHLGEATRGD